MTLVGVRTQPDPRQIGVGAEGGPRGTFRGDIEGLRAVAVLLVLVGHAAPAVLPGGFVGVDVFFVISGFLITGLLVAELRRTGRISIAGFYARRARRLLPAAGLVLLASMLLTVVALPRTRWPGTGGDVAASAAYLMNWHLADRSVDYLAGGQPPSILQHYWSLAVEEQFYLIWPLLLILVMLGAHRAHRAGDGWLRTARWRLPLGLALVAVPSFAWSVAETTSDPARAYFVTTTRLWELALGGGVAVLGLLVPRMPAWLGIALAWTGLGAVAASPFVVDTATAFPGWMALLPTLGTAAVIAGGTCAGRAGPGRVLGLRPVRAVGAISYSLYLWHWPLLVAADTRFGPLTQTTSLAVALASVVPAALTYRYVEDPIRRGRIFGMRPRRALAWGAACTTLVAAAGLGLHIVTQREAARLGASLAQPNPVTGDAPAPPPGAAVLGPHPRDAPAGQPVDRVAAIQPDPLLAYGDQPDIWRDHCVTQATESEVRTCVYGDPAADHTVWLVGDSHAGNWVPPMQEIARANHWRLVTYVKANCPFTSGEVADHGLRPYPSCAQWNRTVRQRLYADRPKLVVTTNMTYVPMRDGEPVTGGGQQQLAAERQRHLWSGLSGDGFRLIVLRDTPLLTEPGPAGVPRALNVPECVLRYRTRLTRCAVPRQTALDAGAGRAQAQAAAGLPNVSLIDLNDAICPADRCAPVIGGALVYRDSNHLTATFARTLTPRLAAALARELT
ncbi:acyltransferase family protein [Micromonospora sp. NBS 11-29]|uniref:acyltransferase family protein n=1 Tax=Micromonospora sp. NBS 11-29 TaxID=1960879 RepID=UPI000B77CA49|nr:acyltransferase family protein [Micromonospora sp. NBS 11-29]